MHADSPTARQRFGGGVVVHPTRSDAVREDIARGKGVRALCDPDGATLISGLTDPCTDSLASTPSHVAMSSTPSLILTARLLAGVQPVATSATPSTATAETATRRELPTLTSPRFPVEVSHNRIFTRFHRGFESRRAATVGTRTWSNRAVGVKPCTIRQAARRDTELRLVHDIGWAAGTGENYRDDGRSDRVERLRDRHIEQRVRVRCVDPEHRPTLRFEDGFPGSRRRPSKFHKVVAKSVIPTNLDYRAIIR